MSKSCKHEIVKAIKSTRNHIYLFFDKGEGGGVYVMKIS